MPEIYEGYKPGFPDRFEKNVTVIYSLLPEFIIYGRDDELCYDVPSTKSKEYSEKFSTISNKMAIVRVLAVPKMLQMINRQMAEAWRLCFLDQAEVANQILDALIDKLLVSGKIKYILSAVVVFAALCLAGFILGSYFLKTQQDPEKYRIIKFALLGAAGGMISILIKMKDLYLDPNSILLNVISGGSRILISVASSIIFYFAYKAQIILSLFNDKSENEIYYLYFCAFIFGFAERFIPEIANEVQESVKIEKKNKHSANN
jgi:peptidoglycan/LPS O-acetylase OafA/YrhL